MHFKLLLLGQLLAVLSCTQIWAHEDVNPTEMTTLPQIVTESEVPSRPEEGLQELDENLALTNQGTALPETTIKNVETTSPTTTTTTTTSSTTTTTEAQKKPEVPPYHPLAYPHLHPYPHPYAHPYPYPNLFPGPASKDTSTPQPETGYPGYAYPNFPILRPPYGSYGAPVYLQRYPSFAPGLGYGLPSPSVDGSTEKSKSDEAVSQSAESTEQAPKLPGEQPNFGFPPIYLIQRRPHLLRHPYASPARGYGSPYGY